MNLPVVFVSEDVNNLIHPVIGGAEIFLLILDDIGGCRKFGVLKAVTQDFGLGHGKPNHG